MRCTEEGCAAPLGDSHMGLFFRMGVFLAAASRGWAGWTPPPPPPLPPSPPVAGHGWPKMAGGEIWPKSTKTKKKRPHLGSLGVQANPF